MAAGSRIGAAKAVKNFHSGSAAKGFLLQTHQFLASICLRISHKPRRLHAKLQSFECGSRNLGIIFRRADFLIFYWKLENTYSPTQGSTSMSGSRCYSVII